MRQFPLRRSLLAQALFAVGLLLLVTVSRISSVAAIHWMGRHDTEAISTLISLRTATYELALQADAARASRDVLPVLRAMVDDSRLHKALNRPGRDRLARTHAHLDAVWAAEVEPALRQGDLARFRRATPSFFNDLGVLTNGLQQEHAALLALDLRLAVGTMLAYLLVLGVGLCLLLRRVFRPLRRLLATTEAFRSGNLGARVDYQARDEIGQLALSFNTMADDLAQSHRRLEAEVLAKMEQLERANATLQLLFRTGGELSHRPVGGEALDELLRRFQDLLPGFRLSLCLQPEADAGAGLRLSLHGMAEPQICSGLDCEECRDDGRAPWQAYPVRSQGEALGELRVRGLAGRRPADWEDELIQALADLIGGVLALHRQRARDQHLLVLNERSALARELHDSLAQSLSFMKLQVSLLQARLPRGAEASAAVVDDLRHALNEAYGQLRELLTSFRLGLGGEALGDALQRAVQEFTRRSGISLLLEADSLLLPLTDHEQVQVVQILREALSNCARHAGASRAWVVLRQVGAEVELLVEDDGRGPALPAEAVPGHGLQIMAERARAIGGSFQVGPREAGGTRVRLRFQPGSRAEATRGAAAEA